MAWPSLAMIGDILLVLSETVLVPVLAPRVLIRCALKTENRKLNPPRSGCPLPPANCPLREASVFHSPLATRISLLPRSGPPRFSRMGLSTICNSTTAPTIAIAKLAISSIRLCDLGWDQSTCE